MRAVTSPIEHRNFENYRDLLLVLLQKEIKVRYKDTVLGYVWSVANPLVFALVYYTVFSTVMKVNVENYALVLICGMFPWQWLTNSIGSSPRLFLANASIIKKIYFPRSIIILATCLNHMIHFLLTLPVILVFFVIYQQVPHLSSLPAIIVLCAIQLLMAYGLSLLLATLNLFLGDIERLVGIILSLVFFFTPVLYTEEMIPDRYRELINLNPAGTLIVAWKRALLEGVFDVHFVTVSFLYALAFFVIGRLVYKRLSWRFAEII